MSSIAYASWLGQIERECSDRLPLNFDAYRQQILAADDNEAAKLSDQLYNRMTAASAAYKREGRSGDENVHLVMTKCPDGSMYLQDMNGHGVIRILKRGGSMYEISGPKFLMEIWGGRGVGDTYLRRMEDGDFMHDRYQAKRE